MGRQIDFKIGIIGCGLIGTKRSQALGSKGKLISALWDDWKNWVNYKQLLQNSDAYTLRRIVGKDRGFEWGDK